MIDHPAVASTYNNVHDSPAVVNVTEVNPLAVAGVTTTGAPGAEVETNILTCPSVPFANDIAAGVLASITSTDFVVLAVAVLLVTNEFRNILSTCNSFHELAGLPKSNVSVVDGNTSLLIFAFSDRLPPELPSVTISPSATNVPAVYKLPPTTAPPCTLRAASASEWLAGRSFKSTSSALSIVSLPIVLAGLSVLGLLKYAIHHCRFNWMP